MRYIIKLKPKFNASMVINEPLIQLVVSYLLCLCERESDCVHACSIKNDEKALSNCAPACSGTLGRSFKSVKWLTVFLPEPQSASEHIFTAVSEAMIVKIAPIIMNTS